MFFYKPKSKYLILFSIFIGMIAFSIDITLPAGMMGGISYAFLPLIGCWSSQGVHVRWIGAISAVFVAIGYFIAAPSNELMAVEILHRAISVLIILTIVFLVDKQKIIECFEQTKNKTNDLTPDRAFNKFDETQRSVMDARLTNAQNLAHFGFWERHLDPGHVWWSAAMYEIFDVDQRFFHPNIDNIIDLLDEEYRDTFRRFVNNSIEHKESYDVEFCITLKTGDVRIINSSCKAVLNEADEVVSLHGICRDVTQQRQLEQEHFADTEMVKAIVDNSIDGFIMTNPYGLIESINTAAEKIFNYKSSEIIGRNIDLLIDLHETSGITALIGSSSEQVGRSKQGGIFPIFSSIIQIESNPWLKTERRKQKRDGHLIVSIQDLSERKVTENALRQSQKMEAIGQLTGGIAHDFNNFLGIIVSSLDLVSDDVSENEEVMDSIYTAQRAAERGSALVSRLLRFSQVKSRSEKPLNANTVIDGMTRLIEQSLPKEVLMHKHFDSHLWAIAADPSEFEESLLNLAINARDAISGAGVLIIETENLPLNEPFPGFRPDFTPGDYVVISIYDSGAGIHPDHLSSIFEPFFTTKEDGHGTGLGLSMVYGFVRRSGGQITVDSKVDVGTTFRIFLPRVDFVKNEELNNKEKNRLPMGHEAVLVVDDVEDMARMAAATLTKLGYAVRSTSSSKEAYEILKNEGDNYQLLFTDLVMPDIDGFELAEHAHKHCEKIKVLVTSGYSERLNENDTYSVELQNVLAKPYRRSELATRVRAILDDTSLN